MKSAFQSPPGPDAPTPETLSHPHSQSLTASHHHLLHPTPSLPPSACPKTNTRLQRRTEKRACSYSHCMRGCKVSLLPKHLQSSHTLQWCLQLIHYQNHRLFIFTVSKQQASIKQRFLVFCLSFFPPYMPLGHPLMSLRENVEAIIQGLAVWTAQWWYCTLWLHAFIWTERRIEKKETSQKSFSVSHSCPAGWLHRLLLCVYATSEWCSPTLAASHSLLLPVLL